MSPSARRTLEVAYVVLASLVLGGVTSYAQGFLPDALASLANSPSGWTALTALVIALARPRLLLGAALGLASFVCLVLGYTIASELRGLTYDPLFWSAVGVVGGPFVGAAAASLRGDRDAADPATARRAAALGSGLLTGILVGDGIYGLTVVAGTTSPVYWTLCLVVGVLLLVAVAMTRVQRRGPVLLQVGTAVVVTLGATLAHAVLNGFGGV